MAYSVYTDARARAAWRACLASALRTGIACAVVALVTLYGPARVRDLVGFPAFSYVTVILVVTDSSLGDTVRGCWLALYATVQGLGPAALCLWLVGPGGMTRGLTAVAVGVGGVVVALPESTHIVAKRIALGEIVLVYAAAFINNNEAGVNNTEPILLPLRLALSVVVALFACVFALLLPFPRLASNEVKHNCNQFTQNVSERLKNLVKAFCSDDKTSALESMTQAKTLALMGTKLVQTVKRFQESMQWERPPLKCLKPRYFTNPAERMQELEVPLRGLEMALTNSSSFPIKVVPTMEDCDDQDVTIKTGLLRLVENNMINLGSGILLQNDTLISTDPESTELESPTFQQKLPQTIPQNTTHFLPSLFFLFCMKLVLHVTKTTPMTKTLVKYQQDNEQPSTTAHACKSNDTSDNYNLFNTLRSCVLSNNITYYNSQRLMYAFKCSLSLGLAMFFGFTYSKPDGFWAGLPVAVSLSAGRDAAFRAANLKAQGTVLGTVYGVLVWFLFGKSLPSRLVSLLPWLVFTSFLQRSKMYGQAGAISAVIGAILVLGRKGFGTPKEFAVARIVETFIGLSCSIMVDLIFQPTRASTLSKTHLSKSLEALCECVNSLTFRGKDVVDLQEKRKKLRMCIDNLGKFAGEADLEPSFWFLPFPSDCYGKLLKSLSRTADLLDFSARSLTFLHHQDHESLLLYDDLGVFKDVVGSSVKCVHEITEIKSLPILEEEAEKSRGSNDIEMGKCGKSVLLNDSAIDEVMSSYLEHSREIVENNNIDLDSDKEEVKREMVLGLSALGFCLSGLMKEIIQIEVGIKEVIQWENPFSRVNLNEIYCMIHALKKK